MKLQQKRWRLGLRSKMSTLTCHVMIMAWCRWLSRHVKVVLLCYIMFYLPEMPIGSSGKSKVV